MRDNNQAEDLLKQARELLRQEAGRIQVIGRGLTPEEEHRSQNINEAIASIDRALEALGRG